MPRMVAVFSFEEPEDKLQMGIIIQTLKEQFQDFIDVKAHLANGRAANYIMDLLQSGLETRNPLVEHAKRELALVDEEEDDGWKESIVKAIQAITSYDGHSEGSMMAVVNMLTDLLLGKNLSPLTDDPKDWMLVGNGAWQSRRCSEAFSQDGGKTYYLLSEGASEQNPEPLHQSEPKLEADV